MQQAEKTKTRELVATVKISGMINDEELSAEGEASGDPTSGEYKVRLEYHHIPNGWHPFLYTEVKNSWLFLREEKGGKNFLTLAGGTYKSAGSIDLGNGFVLRNNTDIRRVDNYTFRAVYLMVGTARFDEMTGMDYFEETLLPLGDGQVAALAIAQWQTRGKPVNALFSTRYIFDAKAKLSQPQVRRFEAKPTLRGNVFECHYHGFVRALPRLVEDRGPYIGHLIG